MINLKNCEGTQARKVGISFHTALRIITPHLITGPIRMGWLKRLLGSFENSCFFPDFAHHVQWGYDDMCRISLGEERRRLGSDWLARVFVDFGEEGRDLARYRRGVTKENHVVSRCDFGCVVRHDVDPAEEVLHLLRRRVSREGDDRSSFETAARVLFSSQQYSNC